MHTTNDLVRHAARAGLLFVIAAVSLPAGAATISIEGGFTNFYTPFVYGTDNGVVNHVNGQQLCASTGCNNDGEAFIDYGTPVTSVSFGMVVDGYVWTENLVSFTPATNQTVNGFGPSNNFLLGTLTYTNGIWSAAQVRLSYNLTATSPDAMLGGYDFELSGVLVVQATPDAPGNSPAQNADYVYVEGEPGLGSVRAYELGDSPTGSNSVTVDVYGYLDSLHLLEFANARGGGFIDAGTDLNPTPVPEPETWELMAAGLASLEVVRRRARA